MSDWRAIATALSAVLLVAGCGPGEADRGVWFVHATDPHLFEKPEGPESERLSRERESLEAFERLLATIDALPDSDVEPAFLLLTGDLGFGEEPTDEETQTARAETIAEALAKRPGLTVYFVPGNNDVEGELIGNIGEADTFLDSVRTRVRPQGVELHDLTACYRPGADTLDGCTFDIPGTRFRLIGFPTFSFKQQEPVAGGAEPPGEPPPPGEAQDAEGERPAAPPPEEAGAPASQPVVEPAPAAAAPPATAETPAPPSPPDVSPTDRDLVHAQWIERLGLLVSEARRERKKALIATHIPDISDPYDQAKGELYRLTARTGSGGPAWAQWVVTPQLYGRWRAIVDSPTVSRVLAGHFHDNHKEIYRQPYAWERDPPGAPPVARPNRGKLWVAPPLGVRLQHASPIQARGFALVGLIDGQPVRRLYWYDQARRAFEPEEPAGPRQKRDGDAERWLGDWAARLWDLPGDADPLGKTATLLLALTAAFLTVVAIWKIPPSDTRLAPPVDPSTGKPPAAAAPAASSPFDNNFARMVLGGLTGLAGVAFVDSLWKRSGDAGLDLTTYYIVCFLLFFLAMLFLYSLVRGAVESLRSRLASLHRAPERTRKPKAESSFLYWGRRSWRWLLSLRASFVVFFDTAFNVVQGQNQLETAVLGRTIVDLQKSLVDSVDEIARQIDRVIVQALLAPDCALGEGDCRVNISVMADDGKSLSYVSLEGGSLPRPFSQRSIAWVAATIGEARWWRSSYQARAGEIEFFDNSKGILDGFGKKVKLSEVYEERGGSEYEAFLVLPLPWERGRREGRPGAIHISFSKEVFLQKLWKGLDRSTPDGKEPRYDEQRSLVRDPRTWSGGDGDGIQPLKPEVNAVLHMALVVLPALLRNFNHPLFEDLIKQR